ncbi:hypothetical protein ACR77J_16660 [Tissierella praeacuta]|uniref:hypothetical protein n=1 Tax=Tissierella praeacuta TaxID=43131 RepID=UPI003DA3EC5E
MPYETVEEYFYKVAKKNGFISLLYDPRCRTKEDVDLYIKELLELLGEEKREPIEITLKEETIKFQKINSITV